MPWGFCSQGMTPKLATCGPVHYDVQWFCQAPYIAGAHFSQNRCHRKPVTTLFIFETSLHSSSLVHSPHNVLNAGSQDCTFQPLRLILGRVLAQLTNDTQCGRGHTCAVIICMPSNTGSSFPAANFRRWHLRRSALMTHR